jgi:hypothetical protein
MVDELLFRITSIPKSFASSVLKQVKFICNQNKKKAEAAIADKILQGYPRRRTAHTFPFTQELFVRHLRRPYQGVSRIEFFVCCLWIPEVRQGVVCSHSVGLGCSWIFTVIVFNDPCGSTLFVSMYISLALSLRRSD